MLFFLQQIILEALVPILRPTGDESDHVSTQILSPSMDEWTNDWSKKHKKTNSTLTLFKQKSRLRFGTFRRSTFVRMLKNLSFCAVLEVQ